MKTIQMTIDPHLLKAVDKLTRLRKTTRSAAARRTASPFPHFAYNLASASPTPSKASGFGDEVSRAHVRGGSARAGAEDAAMSTPRPTTPHFRTWSTIAG